MRSRHKARSWALGFLCWSALAAASAGAVIALTSAGRPTVAIGVDIVRLPLPVNAHWRPKPITAPAAQLFFAGGKGPRADADADAEPPRIELASVSAQSAAVALNGREGMAARLASLDDPASRASEQACLAEVIYDQGRGQPVEAEIGVGQTVINRALSGAYPRSLCGVAHQRSAADGKCQYRFACDENSGIAKQRSDWELAQDLAARLLTGTAWLPEIGDATHLHPVAEHPPWAKYLQRVKRIGALVFYRGDFAGTSRDKAVAAN